MKPQEPQGQPGVCKSEKCRAPIWWRPHPTTGKMHCFNADGSSHWSTCPDTAAFRKAKHPKASNMLDEKTS